MNEGSRPLVSVDSVRQYFDEIGRVDLLTRDEEVALAEKIEAGKAAQAELDAADAAADAADTGATVSTDLSTDASVEATRSANGTVPVVLSSAERRRLLKKVRAGDAAREALTQANLRLVVSIARRYRAPSLGPLDLIQEGNLGLMRAVERFDHTKGFKFSTYATWWIRQAITHAIAEQSRTIRIPVHMVDTINKVHRAKTQMFQVLKREPTIDEIADEVGLTPTRVSEILLAGLDTISLDSPVGTEDDAGLGDFIEDPDAVEPGSRTVVNMRNQAILEVLDGLSERERRIIELRFGFIDGRIHTLEEVGQEVGVTRERVRQIETKVISKIRQRERGTNLKDFLDS